MNESIQFPNVLPWAGRAGAMPLLPGRGADSVKTLRELLGHLREVSRVDESIAWPESGATTLVRQVLHDLGPCGLHRVSGRDMLELTQDALDWLNSDSAELLVSIFHSRIKFFGELLSVLADRSLTHEEIRSLAQERYQCAWSSLDPVRRRTTWLRALGMVELSFDNMLVITECGKSVLEQLVIETPESIAALTEPGDVTDVEVPAPSVTVNRILAELSDEALHKRRLVLSYIPKTSEGSTIDALRFLVQRLIPKSTRHDFYQFCDRVFGIASSSANSALTTLRAIGLVEPVSRTEFAATDVGHEWVASNNELDLIRIAHCNIAFVGEILQEIDTFSTAPDLANVAHERYGLARRDTAGMRARLQLLRDVGLVSEIDYTRHRITPLGVKLRDELPLQTPVAEVAPVESDKSTGGEAAIPTLHKSSEVIAETLRTRANDTSAPLSFEEAVTDAFLALGIDASHLGGSGDTDVLLTLAIDPKSTVRVVVEAKTSTKAVTEQAISFDAINDHKGQHDADHAAIVAPGFAGDRLRRWAKERQVNLIEAAYLAELVLRHSETPLAPAELLNLFKDGGDAEVDKQQASADHQRRVVGSVLATVHAELEHPDDEVNGSLTHREVYMALRSDTVPPTGHEVRDALAFLASPFVRGVKNDKDSYHSLEKPTVTAARLRALADAIEDSYQLKQADA